MHMQGRFKTGLFFHHLVLGVHKVLDLGLRELAHAQQPRLGADLVAVGLPDLRGRERQLAAVVVQQVPAPIEQDSLSVLSFRCLQLCRRCAQAVPCAAA